jgi:hypothetical protein
MMQAVFVYGVVMLVYQFCYCPIVPKAFGLNLAVTPYYTDWLDP